MKRCEDYPCCGCGPEGCIDYNTTNECQECGQNFHPDNFCYDFCPRCTAAHQIRNGYWDENEGWVPGEE